MNWTKTPTVKQVTLYQAADGSTHDTKAEALRANARLELQYMLSELLTIDDAIETLLANPHDVQRALEALCKELPLPAHMDDD